MCVEIREQLVRITFLFAPCSSQGLNSCPLTWQRVPLPTKTSCRSEGQHALLIRNTSCSRAPTRLNCVTQNVTDKEHYRRNHLISLGK